MTGLRNTGNAPLTEHGKAPYRTWWVFYIDPTEPQGSPWQTAGSIGTPGLSAEDAIERTAGRLFRQPFWAFALEKRDFGSYYRLHYPEGRERPDATKIGPAGYTAVTG